MNQSPLPCVNKHSWRYDLEHADHERIIGPCLSCSKAVTGCSLCPLKPVCEVTPSPGSIRGGLAWLDVPINGSKTAAECPRCGNPVLTRHQRKYCSEACRKDWEFTYQEAVEQEERFRLITSARAAHGTPIARRTLATPAA